MTYLVNISHTPFIFNSFIEFLILCAVLGTALPLPSFHCMYSLCQKDFNLSKSFSLLFQGVLPEETENNNQHDPKWTLTSMEKYMRDSGGDSSIHLGLVSQTPPGTNKRRPFPVQPHSPGHHLLASVQNGTDESGGEESSPSWASSSAGNTPSYGSSGLAFEFNSKSNDDAFEKTTPIITTTSCTPKSTPENVKKVMPLSLSTDLLSALDTDLEYAKMRKSRKDSQSSVKSEDSRGTPSKTSKLRKLLRRTRSAGCSKDVSNSSSHFHKGKTVRISFFITSISADFSTHSRVLLERTPWDYKNLFAIK